MKNVFDYLYNELNKVQCEKFNPDKIYVNQGKAEIANYPEDSLKSSCTAFSISNTNKTYWINGVGADQDERTNTKD